MICGSAVESDPFEQQLKSNLSYFQHGRRVAAMKLWDPEKATPEHMFCVAFLATIIVAKEPKTQIAGMSVLFDIEGCSWRHSPKLKTLLALVKIFYVSSTSVSFVNFAWKIS